MESLLNKENAEQEDDEFWKSNKYFEKNYAEGEESESEKSEFKADKNLESDSFDSDFDKDEDHDDPTESIEPQSLKRKRFVQDDKPKKKTYIAEIKQKDKERAKAKHTPAVRESRVSDQPQADKNPTVVASKETKEKDKDEYSKATRSKKVTAQTNATFKEYKERERKKKKEVVPKPKYFLSQKQLLEEAALTELQNLESLRLYNNWVEEECNANEVKIRTKKDLFHGRPRWEYSYRLGISKVVEEVSPQELARMQDTLPQRAQGVDDTPGDLKGKESNDKVPPVQVDAIRNQVGQHSKPMDNNVDGSHVKNGPAHKTSLTKEEEEEDNLEFESSYPIEQSHVDCHQPHAVDKSVSELEPATRLCYVNTTIRFIDPSYVQSKSENEMLDVPLQLSTQNSNKDSKDRELNHLEAKDNLTAEGKVESEGMASYRRSKPVESLEPREYPSQVLCRISNNPARYVDPLDEVAYSDLDAYKIVRERYFTKEEDKLSFRQHQYAELLNHKKEILKTFLAIESKDTKFLDENEDFQSYLKKKKQINIKQKLQRDERIEQKKSRRDKKKESNRFVLDKKSDKFLEDKPMVFEDDDEEYDYDDDYNNYTI